LALGRLVAEAKGGTTPRAFASVDIEEVSAKSGVSLEQLEHIASLIAQAQAPLAIPGGQALGQSNGLFTAEAALAFNALVENYGKPGGVFISPLSPNEDVYHRPASAKEMADFITTLKSGGVKTLFINGVNPLFELPKSLGFAEALASIPTVISFATFPDETALASDYIFPDHQGLEAWGYQRSATGAMQSVLSGAQPAVSPMGDTRSTADVLIEAARLAGGKFSEALPFTDEVAFIRNKISTLIPRADGSFVAPEINTFASYFQQHGGWWSAAGVSTSSSSASALSKAIAVKETEFAGDGEFFFIPFVSPTLGEAGANKPWLQELPDPMTTVMWNSWVAINPETAHHLGVENDDVVKIISEAGEVEVAVYEYPAIHPEVIAMPFGQGHTAYGRFATAKLPQDRFMGLVPHGGLVGDAMQRGANPADVLGAHFNEAGDL
ncbi:MAG TPA: molybdopterin dinucleotide binding domain-containing protein, partial [Anaerolineales bacterium]|nr:molybdopterin dinucleotide binding domain-containing protein [Anaerolineales bacterium]